MDTPVSSGEAPVKARHRCSRRVDSVAPGLQLERTGKGDGVTARMPNARVRPRDHDNQCGRSELPPSAGRIFVLNKADGTIRVMER